MYSLGKMSTTILHFTLALHSSGAFSKVDADVAKQMVNQIWCADGKTWSNRVWLYWFRWYIV